MRIEYSEDKITTNFLKLCEMLNKPITAEEIAIIGKNETFVRLAKLFWDQRKDMLSEVEGIDIDLVKQNADELFATLEIEPVEHGLSSELALSITDLSESFGLRQTLAPSSN